MGGKDKPCLLTETGSLLRDEGNKLKIKKSTVMFTIFAWGNSFGSKPEVEWWFDLDLQFDKKVKWYNEWFKKASLSL